MEETIKNSELRRNLLADHFVRNGVCYGCSKTWPCDVYQMTRVNDELVSLLWGYRECLAAVVAEMDVSFRPIEGPKAS